MYHSIFDSLERLGGNVERNIGYKGTLGNCLTELKEAIESQTEFLLITHPALIIRSIIDMKINTSDPLFEGLLKKAITLALNVYSRNPSSKNRLESLTEDLEDFRTELISRPHDELTWDASSPDYSRETAREMTERFNDSPIRFIALGHGATMAGLDVFLRYLDTTDDEDSSFYVTRFSRRKLGDDIPRVTHSEIEYLKGLSGEVVVFDEDVCTGITLEDACKFLKKNLNEEFMHLKMMIDVFS